MHPKSISRLIGWTFILLMAVSCTLNSNLGPTLVFPSPMPVTPFPPTASEPTASLPTVQPTAAFTDTLSATDATAVLPPAATEINPPPAATAVNPQLTGTRLSMGKGRTVVYADSSVAAGGSASYLVGAGAGQVLMAMINSANQTLYLQILAPDGSLLVSASAQKNYWQGTLPSNGDYQVSVVSSASAGDFDLGVTIPARVVFDPGAVSATMNATVGANGITTFLMRALQGQTLTVNVTSTVGDVFLTIYGLQDGQPYVRSVTGQTSYTFKLPATQDYVIQCVNTGNKSEDLIVVFKAQ